MTAVHPLFVQALSPFATPVSTTINRLREALRETDDRWADLLRLPFEIEIGDKLGHALEDDVVRAVSECIELHMPDIEARVVALTVERGRGK